MLFFMGSSAHLSGGAVMGISMTAVIVPLVIILALQINAMMGKQGPMTTVKGVIACGFGLWAVLYVLTRVLA